MVELTVINPVIAGTFKNTYTAINSETAAKDFWENLTSKGKYISGDVPKFLFTMMNTKTKELHHFMVNEKPNGKFADYSIDEIDLKLSNEESKQLINESEKAQRNSSKMMEGGKRKRYEEDDDDDSSSSSDSDDIDDLFKSIRFKRANRPIVYWWYTPTVYKIENIFTPTFVSPIAPYVQLWIPRP